MKNINKLTPIVAVIFENENKEKLILTNGMKVLIRTDGSEHNEEIICHISLVNEDGIITEENEVIFWNYILEVEII